MQCFSSLLYLTVQYDVVQCFFSHQIVSLCVCVCVCVTLQLTAGRSVSVSQSVSQPVLAFSCGTRDHILIRVVCVNKCDKFPGKSKQQHRPIRSQHSAKGRCRCYYHIANSRDGSVGIATRLGAGRSGF
jgi:hypothetical protein